MNSAVYNAELEDAACSLVHVWRCSAFPQFERLFAQLVARHSTLSRREGGATTHIAWSHTLPQHGDCWAELQLFRRVIAVLFLFHGDDGGGAQGQEEYADVIRNELSKVSYDILACLVVFIQPRVGSNTDDAELPPTEEPGGGGDQPSSPLTDQPPSPQNKQQLPWPTIRLSSPDQLPSHPGLARFLHLMTSRLEEWCGVLASANQHSRHDVTGVCLPLSRAAERKTLVGVAVNSSHMAARNKARVVKQCADLCLLTGNVPLAIKGYQEARKQLTSCKDWVWAAAAIEGHVTSLYLAAARPSQSTFAERLRHSQHALLASQSQWRNEDLLALLTSEERVIASHYDKSNDTLFLLSQFRYKMTLAKMSLGWTPKRVDEEMFSPSKTRTSTAPTAASPHKLGWKPAVGLSTFDLTKRRLAYVRVLAASHMSRKASLMLYELICTPGLNAIFVESPVLALRFLHQILPVLGIDIALGFQYRGLRAVSRLLWREAQFRLMTELLAFAGLLREQAREAGDGQLEGTAERAVVWYKCFILNVYHAHLTRDQVVEMLDSIAHSGQLGSATRLDECIELPPVSFTNLPHVKSLTLAPPPLQPPQLHLITHQYAPGTAGVESSTIFQYLPAQYQGDLRRGRYSLTWDCRSDRRLEARLALANPLPGLVLSCTVRLITAGAEEGEEGVTLNVEPGAPHTSASIPLKLVGEGPLEVTGYRVTWHDIQYQSTVLLPPAHRVTYAVPAAAASRPLLSMATIAADGAVTHLSAATSCVLVRHIWFGSREEVTLRISALSDLDDVRLQIMPPDMAGCISLSDESFGVSEGQVRDVWLGIQFSSLDTQFPHQETSSSKSGVSSITREASLRVTISDKGDTSVRLQFHIRPRVLLTGLSVLPCDDSRHFFLGYDLINCCGQPLVVTLGGSSKPLAASAREKSVIRVRKLQKTEVSSDDWLRKMIMSLEPSWTDESSQHGQIFPMINSPESDWKAIVSDRFDLKLFHVRDGISSHVETHFQGNQGTIEDIQIQCKDLDEDMDSILIVFSSVEDASCQEEYLPVCLGTSKREISSPSLEETFQFLPLLPGTFSVYFTIQCGHFVWQSRRWNLLVSME